MIKSGYATKDIKYYREQLLLGLGAVEELTSVDFDVIEIIAMLRVCNRFAEVVNILEDCERTYVGERELVNEQVG